MIIITYSGGKRIFEPVSSVQGTAQFGAAACLSFHDPMNKDSDIQTPLCPARCASGCAQKYRTSQMAGR